MKGPCLTVAQQNAWLRADDVVEMSALATQGCGSRNIPYLHWSLRGKENPKWLVGAGMLGEGIWRCWVKSPSGTFKPQVTCWFFKTPALREFIDRHRSFSVQGYPSCGRHGTVRTHTRMCPFWSYTVQNWTLGGEERRVELGEGSFVLKLCDYTETRVSMLEEMYFRWMILVSKAGLPLHLLPIVHECSACSFLAFRRQCFKTEHRIFTVIAFYFIFPVSQLILLLY